jgi:formiminoglutamate deiminase
VTTPTGYLAELAWLPTGLAADVAIDVTDGRVARVEPGGAPAAGAERLRGLVLPGAANAHSHAFHRALRGRTHVGSGTFWTWREAMYGLAATLDPDGYHALARAVFAEMALAGFTAVGEFHYLHHGPDGRPYAERNAMGEALIAAAGDAGLRIALLDTCYLAGGVDQPVAGVQRRFSDVEVGRWAERAAALHAAHADRDGVVVGAAVHSVRAVPADAIAVVAAWADERVAPLHAHVSEQPAENEACLAAYGCTPTQLLADRGAVGRRTTAVHATHLTAEDLAVLGGASAFACLCPTTERDLADGVGPADRLAAAGARLTLGTDSHAVVDPFEEARGVELDLRLTTLRRGHVPVAALLDALTAQGQASLGFADAGRLAVGARADLVAVDLRSVRTAGTDAAHAADTVVYAAGAADVTDVVVDGRRVVRDRAHHLGDVGALLAARIGMVHGSPRGRADDQEAQP